MKTHRAIKLISILILFSLIVSVFPINEADIILEEGHTIDRDQNEYWSDEEIIIDEKLIIRGDLQVENCEIYIHSSEGGEIIVKDSGNLRIESSIIQPYYKNYYSSFSLEMDPGLNLLSFPYYKEDNATRQVLEPLDGHYDSVWHYDPDEGWLSFKPHREDHFNDLKTVNLEMGVLVNITDETSLDMDGIQPKSTEIELKDGSNMVSYVGDEEKKVSTVFSGIYGNVESVYTVTSGEEIFLSENDTMVPGKGYWVEMNTDSILNYQNENGLPEDEYSEFEEDKDIRIHYEPGSTGYIGNSRLEHLGDDMESSGLIIESDSVSIEGSEFKNNFIDVNIQNSSPNIKNSKFENATYSSIYSINSSFDSNNNDFAYSRGYAMMVSGGSPFLTENIVDTNMGIWLDSSNAVLSTNYFNGSLGNSITIHGRAPLLEENDFVDGEQAAIKTYDSNVSIVGNTFFGNQGGINSIGGRPRVMNNLFKDEGYGILVQEGSADIKNNDIREINGWSLDIENSQNISMIDNRLRDSSLGIRISGDNPLVKRNSKENCGDIGVLIRQASDIRFEDNTISESSSTGLSIENSEGIVIGNKIIDNHAGVDLRSSILFIGNTVSNNEINGINVQESSPYFEDNVLSNNENNAMRFERSSSVVRRNSILNSKYHFYLVDSQIKAINSAFDEDRVNIDDNSELDIKNTLNASMDEGTDLIDSSIHESLPPAAEITDVYGHDHVDVDIRPNSIYFQPEDYFWGTVNMTFNVTILDEWETEIPFTLEIRPVNNPPRLLNKTVRVSYEPTRVRWEVVYEDKDGNLPNSLELVVDGNHYQVKEYNESKLDTFNGKKYYYEMYIEPGNYEYQIKAEENNTMGPNNIRRTQFYDLDISPPKPGWFGMSDMEFASVGTVFILTVLVLLYLSLREKDQQKNQTEVKKEKVSQPVVKTLPVMKKRSEEVVGANEKKSPPKEMQEDHEDNEKDKENGDENKSQQGVKQLPVMKKRSEKTTKETDEKDTRKHRVIREEDVDTPKEEESEPVIDSVSDEPVEEDEDKSKKQRVIRSKKSVQTKKRVMKKGDSKDSESGKLKRVLKDD
ncbi:MAG: right-handed parallel beta-helix repeat-containing protein [Candidatus Saliniplasma sp.]